ncbi:hypothetical protein C0991_007773 [Blastosporella zonata]|nr:hypothetical protein C0991_007773 [Blastosporella zonata]
MTQLSKQNTLHLGGVASAETPRHSSPDQTSIPPLPVVATDRNAIIRGASPNQRFMPRSVFEEPPPGFDWTSSAPTPAIDPIILATEYVTEYAEGYQEGYRMSQHYSQQSSDSSSRSRQARQAMEPQILSPSLLPSPGSRAPRADEPRPSSIEQSAPRTRRTLRMEDFYSAPTPTSGNREEPASQSQPVSSSSSSTITPWLSEATLLSPLTSQQGASTTLAPGSNASNTYFPPTWGEGAPTRSSLPPPPASLTPTWGEGAPTRSSLPPPPASLTPTWGGGAPTRSSLPPPPASLTPTWGGGAPTRSSLPLPPASAPATSTAWTTLHPHDPHDVYASSPSSRTSTSSRTPAQRRRSEVSSITPLTSDVMAPPAPDFSLRRRSAISATVFAPSIQPSPMGLADRSPMSTISYDSWGTQDTLPHTLQPAPFMPAYQVDSPNDLGLRMFEDGSSASQSRRSSMLSDIALFPTDPRFDHEADNGNFEDSNSDSHNRTPRIMPRSLPDESPTLYPSPPSQPSDRGWEAPSATDSPYRNRNRNQRHGIPSPSVPSETWYRADLLPGQSNLHARSQSQSQSQLSSNSSDRSSRASHHRTSHPPTTVYDDSAFSHSDTPPPVSGRVNALGLTDISTSPEPYISAPTPITPSREFLRSYSSGSRP